MNEVRDKVKVDPESQALWTATVGGEPGLRLSIGHKEQIPP